MRWAVALWKRGTGSEDGNEAPQYSFPPIVLKLIRTFVPQNLKGELWPDAYKLSLQEFCDGLEIPRLK